jgi:hypothetical protein
MTMNNEPLPGENDENEPAITPEMRAAMEALLSEPFPQKPFALVPTDGLKNGDETEYVIHKDVETERQCVFIFDSIVDAFAVAEEYKNATGRDAEPIECDVDSLEADRFWVRFYRANGIMADLPLDFYKEYIGPHPDDDRPPWRED